MVERIVIPASEAGAHIGAWVQFEVAQGWSEDFFWEQGWLHFVEQPDDGNPYVYLYLDRDQVLEPGTEPAHLGGLGVSPDDTIAVFPDGPPTAEDYAELRAQSRLDALTAAWRAHVGDTGAVFDLADPGQALFAAGYDAGLGARR
jgi:hypothetical protein